MILSEAPLDEDLRAAIGKTGYEVQGRQRPAL